MSDYSDYCKFCHLDISFSDCNCLESVKETKKIKKQYDKALQIKHDELVEAKEVLLDFGFKHDLKSYYDYNTGDEISSPKELDKYWVDCDKYNSIDVRSVVKFIKWLRTK